MSFQTSLLASVPIPVLDPGERARVVSAMNEVAAAIEHEAEVSRRVQAATKAMQGGKEGAKPLPALLKSR